jgi:hypothetical protein
MRSLLLKIGCATAALALSASLGAVPGPNDDPRFAKFKREMMPKVGRKVTVVGTADRNGKEPYFLAFGNWGAYIDAANESKAKDLQAHFRSGQRVKVTGTLGYFPDQHSTREDVQVPPEHFFIVVDEITIVPQSRPAPKQRK